MLKRRKDPKTGRFSPIWWTRFRIGTKEIYRSTRTANKEHAKEYQERLRARLWRQIALGDRYGTWDEAVMIWSEAKKPKRSAYNWAREKAILDWFTDNGLKGLALPEIDKELVSEIRTTLRSVKKSPGTADRFLATFRSVLNFAHKAGKSHSVPFIELFDESEKRENFLLRPQWLKLFEAMPPHLQFAAWFAVVQGWREDNVVDLQWSRVDLERRIAWVWGSSTKSKKLIAAPLHDEALEILKDVPRHEGVDHVFTYKGKPMSRLNNTAFRKARIKAGVPWCRWHDLRHTWASWLAMEGATALEIMELGGWTTMRMVERYSHLSKHHLLDVVNRIKTGTKAGAA